jgi:adenosylcobinamide-phosphate synthase
MGRSLARLVRSRPARILAGAILLDLLAGEPPDRFHPVAWIGRAIAALEHRSPREGAAVQLPYGAGMSALVVASTALTAATAQRAARGVPLGFLLEVWLLKSTFAVRALLAAAEPVRRALESSDLPAARSFLFALVSRRTDDLSPDLVAAAAIESLAENVTDSALAPWLAYALFGLPGAAAYRALNTLDSMIGYRNHYEYLGKAAARADDMANLVPARLGALLIALAAPAGRGSPRRALTTASRHHRRTMSPNAGWTMAAMAGALGLTLEKTGAYRLGNGRAPASIDIRRAQRITAVALTAGAIGVLAATAFSGNRHLARHPLPCEGRGPGG